MASGGSVGGQLARRLRGRECRSNHSLRTERLHPRVFQILCAASHRSGNRSVAQGARRRQMKRLLLAQLLALTVAALTAVALTAAEVQPAPPNDLTVHEWGTFTSVAGQDGSAIEWDALGGGKDDLPGFVNDYGYRCFKSGLSGTVRMETPVVYFYSPQELEAHVKVSFPKGLITEWYPQAKYEVFQRNGSGGATRRLEPNLNGLDNSPTSLTGAIEWPNIQVQPNTSYALRTEPAPSRYYAARGTDSAPLTVGDEHEKFLFYRGVGRFPIPLSARVTALGSVTV